MRAEVAAAVERARVFAQAPAQRGHDRPVRGGRGRLRSAAQERPARERDLGQVGLAHARFTRDQHERADPRERRVGRVREPGGLLPATDQGRGRHVPSLKGPTL